MKRSFFFAIVVVLLIAMALPAAVLTGTMETWHKITLTFEGPETSETATPNPFLDYRLNVTFKHPLGGAMYVLPGYYAADGNAAETGAVSGNKWQVHFAPDRPGLWNYTVSFRKGPGIAVRDERGDSAGTMDGRTGSFQIEKTTKLVPDLRAKGRLQVVGEHYLRFAETGEYFLKCGADAPENLLAYDDFDATPNVNNWRKSWAPHLQDYPGDADDLLWGASKNKGKALLGAIHYLASKGMNVFSFLTFNIDGDDHNVYPYLLKTDEADYVTYAAKNKGKKARGWADYFHQDRFDCSKMDQWERVFTYGDRKGMYLHFKTTEAENCFQMDGGELGVTRKLYYRELIARYGHHLALNWNLGEENTQSADQVKAIAKYIADIDSYDHLIVLHTHSKDEQHERHYRPLLGDASALTGISLQTNQPDFSRVHGAVGKWVRESANAGKKWVVACDEPGDASHSLVTDAEDSEHNQARQNGLWGTLMAGGAGVEWYFGYKHPESDLTCQDWRSRDKMWDQCRYALDFFQKNNIPFWEMTNDNTLSSLEQSYCFAKPGEVYVVYLKEGRTTDLNLKDTDGFFEVDWYNPRTGKFVGKTGRKQGGDWVTLGPPPVADGLDWTILVRRPIPPKITDIARADLYIRDPFIVPEPDTQTYYLYKSSRVTLENGDKRPGVVAYTSKDLETWRGPFPVFHYPDGFWANGSVWAPEVHKYRGKYYLFATFNSDKPIDLPADRPQNGLRASQVCVADHPLGPFKIFANKPHTPEDWLSLDGTLWVEDGIPYMIFCHEWQQITDGTMDLVQLKDDLSAPIGKPQLLFKATDAQWVKTLGGKHEGYVTDGCFLYRTKTGKLLMIWSSFGGRGYTVGIVRSKSGKVAGPWEQIQTPLVACDGGHGMIFTTFDGRLLMPIHQPNSGPIRMHLFELEDRGDTLAIKGELPLVVTK